MTTLGIRHPDWQLRPHGTPAAYRRHLRRGERACAACTEAERLREATSPARGEYEERRRERYAAARALGLTPAAAKSVRSDRTARETAS